MLKTGRFRALRNLPIGWILQAIHSTDLSERLFRITLEGISFLLVWYIFIRGSHYSVIKAFIAVHTVSWLLTGNFWVYMLDSFKWVKNPGIYNTVDFIQTFSAFINYFNCCDAILIYGSMCRKKFHIRSDLDLRVIRRSDSKYGILCLYIAFLTRCYSFVKVMPIDLQVVDGMGFLKHQMRPDEKPVVVYKRDGFVVENEGVGFEHIVSDPESVLKVSNE